MDIRHLDKIEIPKELDARVDSVYKKYKRAKRVKKRMGIIAACWLLFLSGFAFPAYTQNLPVYSKIFSFFERSEYQQYSDELLIESRDSGIKITLTDMIYTGDVLSYGYIIESDEYLGEEIDVDWWIDGNIIQRSGITSVRYKGNNTYVGWSEWYIDFTDKNPNKEELNFILLAEKINALKMKLTQDNIKTFDGTYDKVYEGDWKFPIRIGRVDEGQVIRLGEAVEKDGFAVQLEQIFIDKVGTKFALNIRNNLGYRTDMYEVGEVKIYAEDGEAYETDGTGSVGIVHDDSADIKLKLQTVLEPDSYELVMELYKVETLDYYDIDNKYIDDPYDDSEKFKNAPDRIEFRIPFTIEKNKYKS